MAHRLFTTTFGETWAVAPRADLAFPLVMEVASTRFASRTAARLKHWVNRYSRRGPPWQEVVDFEINGEDGRTTVVLDRFVGVTVSDVVRGLNDERRLLPHSTWLRLGLDALALFRRSGDVVLREPPCPSGLGWTLTGQLVAAPTLLNGLLATSIDVGTLALLVSPEHLLRRPTTERTLVFMTAVLLGWLLTGHHPLDAEVGLELALLRGQRSPAGAWTFGSPDAVVQVLARAMAQEPLQRFATLDEFEDAVRRTVDVPPATPAQAFSTLIAVTSPLVDRAIDQLWAHDECLPATWEGLWPLGLHPLEGLAVLEDRLLESRVDPQTISRRRKRGPLLPQSRLEQNRSVDYGPFLRFEAARWWRFESRFPWFQFL